MIHLLTARAVFGDPSPLLCVGGLAPDGVGERTQKDRSHYRTAPDRAQALAELAARTAPSDAYGEGVLLHLFTDWLWDDECFVPYRAAHRDSDPDWFVHYRGEISAASAWLFHHTDWAAPLYAEMLAIPVERYGASEAVTPEAASAYVRRNYLRQQEAVNAEPSAVFSPELVEAFARRTAERYRQWRGEHPHRP